MQSSGFLEILAKTPESSPAWASLAAGMLVTRLADAAFATGDLGDAAQELARQYVLRVSDFSLHVMLRETLAALTQEARVQPDWNHIIAGRLMAYGSRLNAEGHSAAALDVYLSILSDPLAETDTRMQASLHHAYSLRLLRRFPDAEKAYRKLESAAANAGSVVLALEARLGLAKLAFDRGNLPEAETLADRVIEDARRADAGPLLAKALLDRAAIAGEREQPIGVLIYSAAAIESLTLRANRDRARVNAAIALREIDRPEAARRTALDVAEKSREPDQRIAALLLLYNLAIDSDQALERARVRNLLAKSTLSPTFAVEYYEAVAREFAMRGRMREAEGLVSRVLLIAEEYKMSKFIFRGERALEDVRSGRVPAIYAFRPKRPARNDQPSIIAAERQLEAACAATR